MIYDYFTQTANVLHFIELMLSISLISSSLQNIINRNSFANNGLLPWVIYKESIKLRLFHYPVFDYLYNRKGMLWLNITRIAFVLFFMLADSDFYLSGLVLIATLTYLIYIRSALMCNAADQVNNILIAGLLVNTIPSGTPPSSIVIYFFCCVLIVSYFTSGVLKAHETGWRNGTYLKNVIIARNFDYPFLLRKVLPINKFFFKYASVAIILWQLTSFLIPVLPLPVFYLYLFVCFSFHLISGFLLRLNSFISTFTALLPTLIFVHAKIVTCL